MLSFWSGASSAFAEVSESRVWLLATNARSVDPLVENVVMKPLYPSGGSWSANE